MFLALVGAGLMVVAGVLRVLEVWTGRSYYSHYDVGMWIWLVSLVPVTAGVLTGWVHGWPLLVAVSWFLLTLGGLQFWFPPDNPPQSEDR